MDLERDGDTLTARLRRDFNLMAVQHLKHHLGDARHVRIDLSRSRLVDTEAVMALHDLKTNGLEVTLLRPPAIFYEVLELLGLKEPFEVERLVEEQRPDRG